MRACKLLSTEVIEVRSELHQILVFCLWPLVIASQVICDFFIVRSVSEYCMTPSVFLFVISECNNRRKLVSIIFRKLYRVPSPPKFSRLRWRKAG